MYPSLRPPDIPEESLRETCGNSDADFTSTDQSDAGGVRVARGDSPRPGARPGLGNRAGLGNIVALGLTSLFTDISSEMVVAILPLYFTVALGWTTFGVGLFEGAYQIVSAVFRLVGGGVSDRSQNHKRTAVLGYGLSAATRVGLVTSAATGVPIVAVLLADRVGKGLRAAPRDALISLSSAPHKLASSFGVHRTLDTIGALLGPFLAFVILWLTPGAFDAVFVASLAAACIGVMIISTLVTPVSADAPRRSRPRRTSSDETRPSAPMLLVEAMQQRTPSGERAVLRLAGSALLFGAVTVTDGLIYLVIQRNTSMAPGLFPLLFVGTALVYLALAVPLGQVADRVGRRLVFVVGHVPLLVIYLVLGASSLTFAKVALTLGCLGLFYAATDGVLSAAASELSRGSIRSSSIALVGVSAAVGRFVAAAAFGGIWHRWGLQPALVTFTIGMVAVVLVVTLASALAGGGRQQKVESTTGEAR